MLAHRMHLPPYNHIHPVFHVSQLRAFVPNYTPVFSEKQCLTEWNEEEKNDSQLVRLKGQKMIRCRSEWNEKEII
jgi:hypothetical protein